MEALREYERASLALVERLASDPGSDPTPLFAAYEAALAALRRDAAAAAEPPRSEAEGDRSERQSLVKAKEEANRALLDLIARMSDVERAADVMAALKE